MIRVRDILALPGLQDARPVLDDGTGLDNYVHGVGLLDYEAFTDDFDTFDEHEVIFTGLGFTRGDSALGESVLIRQMNQGVSAIFIKDSLIDYVSDDLRAQAAQTNTAVFFFHRSFTEDIVTDVKNTITAEQREMQRGNGIDKMLEVRDIPGRRRLLHDTTGLMGSCIACAAFPLPATMDSLAREAARQSFDEAIAAVGVPGWFLCWYRGCILAIMAFDLSCEQVDARMEALCRVINESAGISECCGVGDAVPLEYADRSILQALQSAQAEPETMRDGVAVWRDTGWAAFAGAAADGELFSSECRHCRALVAVYDEDHEAQLLSSMRSFVACGGSISATAEALHLHPNSVRNRVAKAKEVLGMDDSTDRVFFAFLTVMFLDEGHHAMTANPLDSDE